MTTLVESYISGLIAVFEEQAGFPADVERSTVRAFAKKDPLVLVVHLGKEVVESEMIGATHRAREILFSVISRGDTPDKDADEVHAAAHPLIKKFNGEKLMGVDEIGTDEPKFANANGEVCLITKRYLFKYRTSPFSLSS